MSITFIREAEPYSYLDKKTQKYKKKRCIEALCGECGSKFVCRYAPWKAGKTQSCGCIKNKKLTKTKTTHGLSKLYIYDVWQEMKAVCYRQAHPQYFTYGGNGVQICDRWKDITLFYQDMGNRPSPYHSIELIDRSIKLFSPENTRWVNNSEEKMTQRISERLVLSWQIKERALQSIN